MSYFVHNDQSGAPSAPATGKSMLYTQTGGRLHCINASGCDYLVGGSAPWNVIRNSGFWFAQRQAPGSATTYSSTAGRAITADGWGLGNSNASATYQRIDTSAAPLAGFPGRFYGQFGKITSNGKLAITQAIEGSECESLRGRNVRLTIQAWADSATQWQLGLLSLGVGGSIDVMPATFISNYNGAGTDPSLGTALSYVAPTAGRTGDNCTAATNSYSCNLTTTPQRFSGVFTVPTTAFNLIPIIYSNGLITAASGLLNLAEVMLTDSEEIYEYTNLGMACEFQRVARFYQKSFALDTLPAQNVGANTGEDHFPSPVAGATAFSGIGVQFLTRMFKAGVTLTLYNPAAANAQIRNVTLGTDCTGSTITANSETGFWVNATAPTSTVAGNNLAVHWTVDSEL
jgi:hypothetical protein